MARTALTPILLPGDPTADLHAVPRQYVLGTALVTVVGATTSARPTGAAVVLWMTPGTPVNAIDGDLYINTT